MYSEYLNEFKDVSKDVHTFHYDENHNICLNCKSVNLVFGKAGSYIINLMVIVFMEKFICSYFLLMHCYEMELVEMKEVALSGDRLEPPFIEMHRFKLMKIA